MHRMHRTIPRGLALVAAAFFACLALPALATAFVSTGDGGWLWQTPQPSGEPLRSVACPDGVHAWAVGDYGVGLVSVNGGRSWSYRRLAGGASLAGVAFADAAHGWIVGAHDTLLVTANGGRTWARHATGLASGVNLTGVTCVGRLHVWAVGSSSTTGYLLRSTDGGAHWRAVARSGARLNAVDFVDTLHGCTVGQSGLVLRTADGGRTWHAGTTDAPADLALYAVGFATRSVGWAAGGEPSAGYDAYLLHTSDGGATWQTQSSDVTLSAFDAVGALSATHAYAICSGIGGSSVYATTDGGASWNDVDDVGIGQRALYGMTLDSHLRGIAVGDRSTVVTTTNGTTWTPRLPHGPAPTVYGLAFGDASHGWAVDDAGVVVATTDAGSHWRTQDLGAASGSGLYGCGAVGAGHAWICGARGLIAATTDGGAGWTVQSSGNIGYFDAVRFHDADHGVAVGSTYTPSALTRYTSDGGTTWQPAGEPASTPPLDDAAWRDASDAVAVGDGGTILLSSDGGADWTAPTSPSPTTNALDSVVFADPEHGWAVGSAGTVVATTDGGASWQVRPCPTTATLRTVACASPTRAWVAGDRGVLLATLDGGRHWLPQKPAAGDLEAVTFLSPTRGFLAGPNGILATTTGGWHVTGRPVTRALAPATVGSAPSATTTLRYQILEPRAPGRIVTATIRIRTLSGRLVETLRLGDVKVGVKHAFGVMPVLKKGHYRWYVYATDAAGHAVKHPGWNTLYVK